MDPLLEQGPRVDPPASWQSRALPMVWIHQRYAWPSLVVRIVAARGRMVIKVPLVSRKKDGASRTFCRLQIEYIIAYIDPSSTSDDRGRGGPPALPTSEPAGWHPRIIILSRFDTPVELRGYSAPRNLPPTAGQMPRCPDSHRLDRATPDGLRPVLFFITMPMD